MKLSKRLRKWKANLTTQTPVEYILTLRADVNGFADEVKALERENAKLRELVRCLVYATNPLDRATLIANAAELGIEVG